MRYLLYLLLPFLFAFGCEQKEDQIISDLEGKITGDWVWVKSTYYNTMSGMPYVLTPDSVGFSVRQYFSSDGTYVTFKNNMTESSGIYWLETVDYLENAAQPEIRLYTQKEEYLSFVELKIFGDSLILDNTKGDGTLKLFRRYNQNP